MPLKLFISYAREDEDYKIALEKRLKPYVRNNIIESWSDRAITPGSVWEDEIKQKMNASDVILFLISPDFLASDYIHDVEIVKALARYDAGQLRIIPIVVRPSDLSQLKISKFQALPKDARPISKWDDKDEAWLNVIQGLKRIFNQDPPKDQDLSSNSQPTAFSKLTKDNKDVIRELVSRARVDKALAFLKELSEKMDPDFHSEVIMLSGKFEKLKRDERSGILSNENVEIGRARVNSAILSLLTD